LMFRVNKMMVGGIDV